MAARRTKRVFTSGLKALILVALVGVYLFNKVMGPATGPMPNGEYVYIPTGADFETLVNKLDEGGFIKDKRFFRRVAHMMKLDARVHAGRYHIQPGMSNYRIVRLLRSGSQAPVKVVINKLRTRGDLAALLARTLEPDSATFGAALTDSDFLHGAGASEHTIMAMIIPDTYEMYWNSPAPTVLVRMVKYYDRFWTVERKKKAEAQGVTPLQATIIASIVDEETNVAGDKPLIASVYLNRFRKGIALQADPTVKFAIGDFAIRRVTGPMLKTQSPYNTYMYPGLPPGPVCTPSRSSINAVLDAPRTSYLYFCAKDDMSGRSSFASTLTEHVANARAYHRALNARGIH